MAKKSSIQKNLSRTKKVQRDVAKREVFKAIIMDKTSSIEQRFEASLKLSALPRDGSPVRVRNRCLLTGRARGYYRKFRMSRICLRSLANNAKLPGVVKSSW